MNCMHRVRKDNSEGLVFKFKSGNFFQKTWIYGGSGRGRGDKSIPHNRQCDDAPHRLLLRVWPVLHRLLLVFRRVRWYQG